MGRRKEPISLTVRARFKAGKIVGAWAPSRAVDRCKRGIGSLDRSPSLVVRFLLLRTDTFGRPLGRAEAPARGCVNFAYLVRNPLLEEGDEGNGISAGSTGSGRRTASVEDA